MPLPATRLTSAPLAIFSTCVAPLARPPSLRQSVNFKPPCGRSRSGCGRIAFASTKGARAIVGPTHWPTCSVWSGSPRRTESSCGSSSATTQRGRAFSSVPPLSYSRTTPSSRWRSSSCSTSTIGLRPPCKAQASNRRDLAGAHPPTRDLDRRRFRSARRGPLSSGLSSHRG